MDNPYEAQKNVALRKFVIKKKLQAKVQKEKPN